MSPNESASSTLFNRVQAVIGTDELPALGPKSRANVKSGGQLRQELDLIFSATRVSPLTADLIRAAALLWHDDLDQAHVIVQNGNSTEAAFIHGIVHRREPDYGNAKYWFHRVGQHRTFSKIGARVAEFLSHNPRHPSSTFVANGMWQPMNFIDACAQAEQPHKDFDVLSLQHLQRIEFEALLEHLCETG